MGLRLRVFAAVFFLIALAVTARLARMSPGEPEPSADFQAETLARQAYQAAGAYFTEAGGTRVDLMTLMGLGLVIPREIELSVLDGKPDTLRIRSQHVKGSLVYEVDGKGDISSTRRGFLARLFSRFYRSPGEAPQVPRPPYEGAMSSDPGRSARLALRRAYMASLSFFFENPRAMFDEAALAHLSGPPPEGVSIDVLDGRRESLHLRARHPASGIVWDMDWRGRLSSPAQAFNAPAKVPEGTVRPAYSPEDDEEARRTAVLVYKLAKSFFAEYMPQGGVTLDALKRSYPDSPISPDVNVEIADGLEKSLRIRARHRDGKLVFEADAQGRVTSRPAQ